MDHLIIWFHRFMWVSNAKPLAKITEMNEMCDDFVTEAVAPFTNMV